MSTLTLIVWRYSWLSGLIIIGVGLRFWKKKLASCKKFKMYLIKKKNWARRGRGPLLGVLSHIHMDSHLTLYKIMAKYVAKFVEIDFLIFCCNLRMDWPWTLTRYSWRISSSIVTNKFIIFATTLNVTNWISYLLFSHKKLCFYFLKIRAKRC